MASIVILGGHGKIALLLAEVLAQRGDAVTSVIRNPDHAGEVHATGATSRVLDIENSTREQIGDVIAGADAVVFSAGAGGGSPERTYAVDRDAAIRTVHAAEAVAVPRFVMVSYLGSTVDHAVPESDPFFPYAEAKAAADVALRASDLQWTVLMPGSLTDDEPSGSIDADARPKSDNPGTSRANVALVAAAVLADDSTIGTDIAFTDGAVTIEAAVREP